MAVLDRLAMNPAQHLLVFLAKAYRAAISPALTALFGPLGFGCRFTPTCSQYAIDAVRSHGAVKGSCLALGRLCRCQPWGGSGFDPVPPSKRKQDPTAVAATVKSQDEFSKGQPPASSARDLTVAAAPERYPSGQLPLKPAQHGS
jgi:putative membrane protein insertion efficiency factor